MADLQTKFKVFREVSSRTDLTPAAHKVFSVLLITHHNLSTGRCDPSISVLVKSTGLGRATVLRALADLRTASILEYEPSGGGASKNSYSFPSLAPAAAAAQGSEKPLPVSDRDGSETDTGIVSRPVSENNDTGLNLIPEPVSNRDPNKESNKEKHTRRADARVREREGFARFWAVWPNKVGKKAAEKVFRKFVDEIEDILGGVERYERFVRSKPPERQAWLNPVTFLDGERWKDEPAKLGVKPAAVDSSSDDPIIEFPGGFKRPTSYVREALVRFVANPKSWPHFLGPAPDRLGCLVPKHLLTEETVGA